VWVDDPRPVRRRTTTGANGVGGGESTDPVEAAAAGESGDPGSAAGGGPVGRVLVGFAAVTVFDVAQTDGDPLPELPVMRRRREAPAGLWDGLVEQVQARGSAVGGEDPSPALGVTRYASRTVDITRT